MTEIAFHFNVADRLGYCCRLLRKASATGARAVVIGDDEQLGRLDPLLWSFSPVDFIAHERVSAPAPATGQAWEPSPVLLMTSAAECPHHEVLINLADPTPEQFERFERVIEIVGSTPDERLKARQRWRHYADRGYRLQQHDQGKPAGA